MHIRPNMHTRQAPTYHVVIEVLLGLWIVYLLFFSKQYRPKSKHDKLTKEVKWWCHSDPYLVALSCVSSVTTPSFCVC